VNIHTHVSTVYITNLALGRHISCQRVLLSSGHVTGDHASGTLER